jgi:hypothetical protein
MADVDPALEYQVLNIAQAERKSDVNQNHQPDHLRRGVEVSERTGWLARAENAKPLQFRDYRRVHLL